MIRIDIAIQIHIDKLGSIVAFINVTDLLVDFVSFAVGLSTFSMNRGCYDVEQLVLDTRFLMPNYLGQMFMIVEVFFGVLYDDVFFED